MCRSNVFQLAIILSAIAIFPFHLTAQGSGENSSEKTKPAASKQQSESESAGAENGASSRRKTSAQEKRPSSDKINSGVNGAKPTENSEPTKEELAAIEFDVESKEPIFEYFKAKSFVAPTNGKKFVPDLQLFPNGRAILGGRDPRIEKFDSSVSKSELTEFLNLVVNQNRFYEIDMDETEKEMKSKKAKVTIADANSQAFMVNLPKGKKEVQIYALYNAVRNYPEIKDISRLARIEKACDVIMTKIHLGDDGPAALAVVNKACKEHEQKIEPFVMDDLRSATRMKGGRFQVSFQRIYPAVGKTPEQRLYVIYFRKDADSKPAISFYGLPRK
ncbi:MAG: hypothetical protein AB8B55_11605 [Mariniblastus sp.]